MNSVRPVDLEVVELLRDEPDLLAIADAIATTQSRDARRRLPAGGWRLLAVAATVAVAIGLGLAAPWEGQGGGIADRALAAVGQAPVLHAVIESDVPHQTIVTLATGKRTPLTQQLAYWYDSDRHLLRVVSSIGGNVLFDLRFDLRLRQPGTQTGQQAPLDPALTAFISGYRDALQSGQAREIGRGAFDGHTVIWLRFDYRLFGERVGIDATSYRPLVIEPLNANGTPATQSWRVRTINTSTYRVSDFKSTGPVVAASAHTGTLHTIAAASAAKLLGWTPVWLGQTFRGRALQYTQIQELIRYRPLPRRATTGLMFAYGHGADRITVMEAPRAEQLYGYGPGRAWGQGRPPALGTALLTTLATRGGPIGSQCQAQLRAQGLWLTITGWNQASTQCIAVAQALVPLKH